VNIRVDPTPKTMEAIIEPVVVEPTVLLLAPRGRDARVAVEVLRGAGISCHACLTADDLTTRIGRGAGPAVISTEALNPEQAIALETVLADQPAWSDPPLVLLAGNASVSNHLHQLLVRPNTTLLQKPLKVATLVTATRAALQNRLRQREVGNLLDRLKARAEQLQRLSSELTLAEQRERSRIAQVLHDHLQQNLVAAKYGLDLLLRDASRRQAESVRRIYAMIDEAIQVSRSLTAELAPPILHDAGLAGGLEWLREWVKEKHGLEVSLHTDPQATIHREGVLVLLFQSVRELLFNAVKHAHATHVSVELLTHDAKHRRLTIQDNGQGFDQEKILDGKVSSSSGFGLFTIRERLAILGGRLEIQSARGRGASFDLIVPKDPEQPESFQGSPAGFGSSGGF
jgi:signal transduction histidine kinase